MTNSKNFKQIAEMIISLFTFMNGANFIGVTYRNAYNELSKYVLIADFKYHEAVESTKAILRGLTEADFNAIASKGINNVSGVKYATNNGAREFLTSGKLPKEGTKARETVLNGVKVTKTLQTICNEMISSFEKNANVETKSNQSIAQSEMYEKIEDRNGNVIPSMKYHTASETIHIYAMAHSKVIIEAGTYTESEKLPETIQKEAISKYCKYVLGKELPTDKYRNLKVTEDQLSRVKVLGTEIICE